MNLKKKVKTVKRFVEEHKVPIAISSLTVVCLIVGGRYFIKIRTPKTKAVDSALKAVGTELDEIVRTVNEGIFADLAPEIADYVLDNGINHAVCERSYDIGDNLFKIVTVTVKQYAGD